MERFLNVNCFNHPDTEMACYCPDCVEALCSECACYHTIHNKHRPVPNVFIKFMPAFILQKINRCLHHNTNAEFLTSNHGNPCCKMYLKTVHKNCNTHQCLEGHLKHIKLEGSSMFKVNAGEITGCTILPSGQMVFVDHKYDCLIIHDKDGSHNRTINLLYKPYGVAFFIENKIAITQATEVILFNLQTDLTEKWIDVGFPCFGIHVAENRLIVTVGNGKGINILDIEGNLINTIHVPNHGITDSCLYKNNIYISVYRDENMVYCVDQHGHSKWTVKDQKLRGPHQLTIDNNGYCYVIYETSLKVVVISPDGKCRKNLLCDQDGLHSPKAIACRDNTLLVCNSTSCTAFVYTITNSSNNYLRDNLIGANSILILIGVITCLICFVILLF